MFLPFTKKKILSPSYPLTSRRRRARIGSFKLLQRWKRHLDLVGEINDFGRVEFNLDGEQSDLSPVRWKMIFCPLVLIASCNQVTGKGKASLFFWCFLCDRYYKVLKMLVVDLVTNTMKESPSLLLWLTFFLVPLIEAHKKTRVHDIAVIPF